MSSALLLAFPSSCHEPSGAVEESLTAYSGGTAPAFHRTSLFSPSCRAPKAYSEPIGIEARNQELASNEMHDVQVAVARFAFYASFQVKEKKTSLSGERKLRASHLCTATSQPRAQARGPRARNQNRPEGAVELRLISFTMSV